MSERQQHWIFYADSSPRVPFIMSWHPYPTRQIGSWRFKPGDGDKWLPENEELEHLRRLHEIATEKLAKVRIWREKHGEHAGRAPLAELDAILDGE
jgi:hypothetical protein